MKNIELNVGGFIGAIAVGGLAAAVLYSKLIIAGNPTQLMILGVILGAFGGNFVWSKLFPPTQPESSESLADQENRAPSGRRRAASPEAKASAGSVWGTILAVVILIAGITVEFFTVGLFLKAKEVEKWPTVVGTITRSELKAEFADRPEALIEFDYQVADAPQHGTKVRARGNSDKKPAKVVELVEAYPVGKEVTVYVNPADPKEAFLESGLDVGEYIMIISPLVFAFAAGAHLVQTWRGKQTA